MRCKTVKQSLAVNQTLTEGEQAHLAVCETCQAFAQENKQLMTWAKTLTVDDFHLRENVDDQHSTFRPIFRFVPLALRVSGLALLFVGLFLILDRVDQQTATDELSLSKQSEKSIHSDAEKTDNLFDDLTQSYLAFLATMPDAEAETSTSDPFIAMGFPSAYDNNLFYTDLTQDDFAPDNVFETVFFE